MARAIGVQSLTDQLRLAGIAIAPDLLSGMGPNGGGTSSLIATKVGQAIRDLPPDQITADLNAVATTYRCLPQMAGW
jgi:carboxymethylenebutenolidase